MRSLISMLGPIRDSLDSHDVFPCMAGFSDGIVLEVVDTFETLYRCRIGAKQPGTEALEKHCLEDEIMPSRAYARLA